MSLVSAEEARSKTRTEKELYESRREDYLKFLNDAIESSARNARTSVEFQKGQYHLGLVSYFKPEIESLGYSVILNDTEFVISWGSVCEKEKLSS